MNRTGIAMSPLDTAALFRETPSPAPSPGDERLLAQLRSEIGREAEPLGTVPLPGTLKGAATTVVQKLKGKRPEVFLDKLGERIAFERSGVRLYDLLLAKCRMRPSDVAGLDVTSLEAIRDEELRHFELCVDAMRRVGGDPTAMTPAADVTGILATGLVQTLSEARTTVPQALQAILVAELADNDAWSMLIELTKEQGLDDVVKQFRAAEAAEKRHLAVVRGLLSQAVLQKSATLH